MAKAKWLFVEKIDKNGDFVSSRVIRGFVNTVQANRALAAEKRIIRDSGNDGEYRAILTNAYDYRNVLKGKLRGT